MSEKKVTTKQRKVVDERAEELEQKFMSAEEMKRMELNGEKEISRQMSVKIQELVIENIKLQMKSLESGLKVETMKLSEVKRKVAEEKVDHKKFTDGLREKYDLPTPWGYDPETGELK